MFQIKTNQDKRGVALMQFSLMFVDIPAALCAAVVLVTGFKAPKMIRRLKEVRANIFFNFYTSTHLFDRLSAS